MRTIAVIALKGGSGKTTLATHLALAAHLRGQDVLVADTDPQASAKDVLGSRQGEGPSVVQVKGTDLLSAQMAAKGLGKDLVIIDTAAGAVEDVGEALVLADYSVLVVRPTMLDLAGLARTVMVVRRLKKPCAVVMNQAPVPREGVEAPVVKRFLRGLEVLRVPIVPIVVRARTVYQTVLETGRSAEEMGDPVAAAEISALWDFVWKDLDEVLGVGIRG